MENFKCFICKQAQNQDVLRMVMASANNKLKRHPLEEALRRAWLEYWECARGDGQDEQ